MVKACNKIDASYPQRSAEIIVLQSEDVMLLEQVTDEVVTLLERELGCDPSWDKEQ